MTEALLDHNRNHNRNLALTVHVIVIVHQ